jgi:hypothetical protein
VYFQKHKLINSKEKSKTKAKEKRKQNQNMYISYKGCHQAKYLFKAWPFTG